MGIVIREMDRLNRLLSDFLSYARPQDTFSSESKEVSMRSLLEEILLLLSAQKKALPERLKVEWKDELKGRSLFVRGNEDSLKQALLNIFINAYQAMIQDKNTTHPTLTLTLKQKENNLHIKIRDNGPGIAKEMEEKIFEPFHSTKETGSGLGLSIAYQIIQHHKGGLKLNPHISRGTEFILSLPATFTKEHQNQRSSKSENKNLSR